jgi:alcohol dehydrogenase, propanol-preferring
VQAYRIVAWQQPAELVEVPVPDPGPGQVRVRVAGCGLCHSDAAMAAVPGEVAEAMGWRLPFTLGHETAGWVDAVGADVDGIVEGTAVALASPSSCGRCRTCRAGRENACEQGLVGRGYGRDGGLAGHVLVDDPARALVALGALDPTGAGPLTDAAATSHHAVARLAPRLRPGGAVLVIGAGGLGAVTVQLLRTLTSARIVALDPNPARRAVAEASGAHDVVDGVDDATPDRLRDLLGRQPVDGVVDLVGTDATIALGADTVSPGGGWVVVGAGGGTMHRPWFGGLPRDVEVVSFQGSDLADLRGVVALAAAGRLDVATERFALDEVASAYAALDAGTLQGRAVVVP